MPKVIAIDGPASSGKSTLAKLISKKYKYPILSSGRIYRAIALEALNNNIRLHEHNKIIRCVSKINYEFINSKNLYSSEIDMMAANIATLEQLRKRLIKFQRGFPKIFANKHKYVVVEGRDIGTVVFPEAKIKLFMWASPEVRAKRRYKQIQKSGGKPVYKRVYSEIIQRDKKD